MSKIDDGPPRINPAEVALEILIKWMAVQEARTIADQMSEESRTRDWFAGMALSGLISTLEYPDADMAFRCYALADAMIDARKADPEGDA